MTEQQYNLIEDEFEKLKSNGICYFIPEEKNVCVTGFSFNGDEITASLLYGYGLNSVKLLYSFKTKEIDDFKRKLIPKRKNDNFSLQPKLSTHPKQTYKYSLRMSDTTENNIGSLRGHLFSAIEKLEGGTMKHEEAKAMASLAQTIINSAKLELEYKRMVEKTPNIVMLNG